MKERKYKEDWVNETRFDEKTGREKRVPVYRTGETGTTFPETGQSGNSFWRRCFRGSVLLR